MSAMNHVPSDHRKCEPNCWVCGHQTCLYCGERWPCEVAQLRLELAQVIQAEVVKSVGGRPSWKRGMLEAADVISKGLTP